MIVTCIMFQENYCVRGQNQNELRILRLLRIHHHDHHRIIPKFTLFNPVSDPILFDIDVHFCSKIIIHFKHYKLFVLRVVSHIYRACLVGILQLDMIRPKSSHPCTPSTESWSHLYLLPKLKRKDHVAPTSAIGIKKK